MGLGRWGPKCILSVCPQWPPSLQMPVSYLTRRESCSQASPSYELHLQNLLASETSPESPLLITIVFHPSVSCFSHHCFPGSSWVEHARSAGPAVTSQEDSDVPRSHSAPGKLPSSTLRHPALPAVKNQGYLNAKASSSAYYQQIALRSSCQAANALGFPFQLQDSSQQ